MNIITSLSPNPARAERQCKCIESWLRLGAEVHAVQTANELSQHHDDGPFIVHSVQGDCVHMTDIWNTASAIGGWCMLTNADTEFLPFAEELEDLDQTVGVDLLFLRRFDRRDGNWMLDVLGFDTFLFHADKALQPFAPEYQMGKPWWDYALPTSYLRAGRKLFCIEEPIAFHEPHHAGWTREEWQRLGGVFAQSQPGRSIPELAGNVAREICEAAERLTLR